MSPWSETTLTVIADDYDRYGEYLRLNSGLFRDSWSDDPAPVGDPAEFAVHAWTVATGPIMVPGYVRVRPDLMSIALHWDEDDGGLYAQVSVPLHHRQIGGRDKRFPYAWQDWTEDRGWGETGEYVSVREPDDTKRPAVLATAVVRVSGRDWDLVTPAAYEGRTLTDGARETVERVARHVNEDAGPIVARLLK